jgi:hypothetical protein
LDSSFEVSKIAFHLRTPVRLSVPALGEPGCGFLHGALQDPLVKCVRDRIEDGLVEPILPNQNPIPADVCAPLVVIHTPVET